MSFSAYIRSKWSEFNNKIRSVRDEVVFDRKKQEGKLLFRNINNPSVIQGHLPYIDGDLGAWPFRVFFLFLFVFVYVNKPGQQY